MQNKTLVPGGPCWVELGTSDPEAAKAFYATLFNWQAATDERPEAGGYTMLSLGDAPVAALTPLYAPGQPTGWTVSFGVPDADAVAAAVGAAGGQVLMPPMDVFDLGRFAVVADPAGAVFSLWQARAFAGAALINEPGSLGWVELATRDTAGALEFYPRIFGWTVTESATYPQFGVDGADFGGLMAMGDQFPPEVPPHWLPYFAVADVDMVAARGTGAGGDLLVPPMDVPDGPRIAVLRDPQGGAFGIYLAGTEG